MSVIYITAIVSLSMMGVGYGYWSDSLSLGVSVSTGDTKVRTDVENNHDCLNLTLLEDGSTLHLTGTVFQGSYSNIPIKFLDEGSVPLRLDSIDVVNTSEIVDLDRQDGSRYILSSFIEENELETFQLSIAPVMDYNESLIMQSFTTFSIQEDFQEDDEIQGKINAIYEEINDIQNEIDRLNIIETHSFEYDIQFIQGI